MRTEPQNTIMIRGGIKVSTQQANVVDSVLTNRLTIVSAGAGSGKTHTSAAAVLHLLDEGHATIDEIILITYTNTGADNIRARIEKEMKLKANDVALDSKKREFWMSQIEKATSAYIGTIHSFCRMILTTFGYNEKVARSSDITFSNYQRQNIISEAFNIHSKSDKLPKLLLPDGPYNDYELRKLLNDSLEYIYNQGHEIHKLSGWTDEQFNEPTKKYRVQFMRMLSYIHNEYKKVKLSKPALDSHDLLSLTSKLFNNGEDGFETIVKLTKRYRYLFVDEFQDTNKLQLGLIEKLLPIDESLPSMKGVLLVGDQKQSIFGFSGAHSSLLGKLAKKRHVNILPINVARRPTSDFLDLINTVFDIVGKRVPELNDKMSVSDETFNPSVSISPLTFLTADADASVEEKAKVIANHIRFLLTQEIHPDNDPKTLVRQISPGDIVILTRGNKQLDSYLLALQSELPEIEFRSDRGGSFYQRPEIVATYRLLRAIIHYPDDYIISQAIGEPYLPNIDASKLENVLINYGKIKGNLLTDQLKIKYPEAFNKIEDLRRRVKIDTVPHFLELVYRTFDVRGFYKSDSEAIMSLEQLREKARNLFENDQALTLRTFVDYLETNILTGQSIKEVIVEDEDDNRHKLPLSYVRLMTIHRSKGLEFKIVIIPDAQKEVVKDKILPSFMVLEGHGIEVLVKKRQSVSPRYNQSLQELKINQYEEEMRIFYVALTRAEQAVVIVGTEPNPTTAEPKFWNSWQDPIWWGKNQNQYKKATFPDS